MWARVRAFKESLEAACKTIPTGLGAEEENIEAWGHNYATLKV